MDNNAVYQQWLRLADEDKDLIEELKGIEGKDDEILDRFYRTLEFGTAGLRGVLGAGTNRMNIYTVNQATQGLADFLNMKYAQPSVAIAYDSRIKSDYFAREAARVLAGNGIKVYFFPELVPTPVLSFAIRYFKTSSGIIITASHNPAKYNGYKCYDPNGYQMTDEEAAATYQCIQKVDVFRGVKRADFEDAVKKGTIEFIKPDVMTAFLDAVETQCVHPGICKAAELNVIYTPLNGTGNKPVREMLRRLGIEKVTVVPEQELPDGRFPTCPFPNPEIQQAFEYALKLTNHVDADLLVATDPDCDRVGIAVKQGGSYQLMSGNEVGAVMLNYLLSERTAKGAMPKNPIAVKTIVTTELARAVAQKYGCEMVDLLTGFKYIGELITSLEAKGEADRFIMGFEESYGYLAGTHARDKDAVVAVMLICEMAAFYKTKGLTLVDVVNGLYEELGMYRNKVENFAFEGAEGMEKMQKIMACLRENPPQAFGGLDVEFCADYLKGELKNLKTGETRPITLPKSNVLSYKMENGNGVIVRPSGTEPKIKAYLTACAATKEASEALADAFREDITAYMKI